MMKLTPNRIVSIIAGIIVAIIAVVIVTACTSSPSNTQEREQQERGSIELIRNQPIPFIPFSQMRANLIELEQAQANGLQSTSFMFNVGIERPYRSCPSIGFPIANTASLSNPLQAVGANGAVVQQLEPNGIYPPSSSSGTYVICVNPDGTATPVYVEGYVHTEMGPARYDEASKQVITTGPPSGKFTTKR